MAAVTQLHSSYDQELETVIPISCYTEENRNEDIENSLMECTSDFDLVGYDTTLCVSGSRLIKSGFISDNCTDKSWMFINAGGGSLKEGEITINAQPDSFFEGGDVIRTNESIIDGGEIPSIYQSARLGNFSYKFSNLSPGDYLVDLHFAEIVNTNGPKGMRVFDVFIQDEKVLSKLDIYSVAGANKPLQAVDVKVSVGEDGSLEIRFAEICGRPIVSGIHIKKPSILLASQGKQSHHLCHNCAIEIQNSSSQGNHCRIKHTSKYQMKIEELKAQCQLKENECYEAWMSLQAANQQLEKVTMELDNSFFQNMCLDQAMGKQAEKLKEISSQYESNKRLWTVSINELERKIKTMKEEHSRLSYVAHDCANSVPELNKMVFAVQALVAQTDDLKLRLSEEQVKRMKLYNQVQEAKGNIRVFCRCRPLSKQEESTGFAKIIDFHAANDGGLGILSGGSAKRSFKFDRVYTPSDDQAEVFADASPMVDSVLDGYNVCLFAYGQTGTGKTYTMEGTNQNRGVNYRTLEHLFKVAEERRDSFTYNISVSVLEVYNEQIRDLLVTSPSSKKLEIRQTSEGIHHVPGLIEAKVENIEEVWDVLQTGSNARTVGSNNVNDRSSRSHCMLCIYVNAKNLINSECTKSKLWLVDLAGSERLAKTDVQGERLKEAQNINRSLSALGDVISALATKNNHIPYRNSKLTHLLQDSLGGDSKTLMFVQISPLEQDLGETLSSLNFATRVRGVELGPAKKQIDLGENQKLKTMLDKAKQELRSRDDALQDLEENFNILEGKAKSRDQLFKNQQEKVFELESQLASKSELCGQYKKQLLQLSQGMKGKDEIRHDLEQKVEELENRLKEREQTKFTILQNQVKELENRLKDRTRDFEVQSGMLKQKVRELENKLATERQNSGSRFHQPKPNKEFEQLSRQKPESVLRRYSIEKLHQISSPPIKTEFSRRESVSGSDSVRSFQSSNNKQRNTNSELLKGAESLRELRRKQIQCKGSENSISLSAAPLERKTLSTEPSKGRHSLDTSRALARITRSAKPVVAGSNGQKSLSSGRVNRGLGVTGGKESSSKLRSWFR